MQRSKFKFWQTIHRLLPLIDVVLLNAITTLAFLLRFFSFPPSYNWSAYLRLFPWDAAALVGIFYVYGLYSTHRTTSADLSQTVATAVIVNGFATLAITFLATTIGYPRSVFLISAVLQVPVFMLWRRFLRSMELKEAPETAILLVCQPSEVDALTKKAGQYLPKIRISSTPPDSTIPDLSPYGAVLLSRDVSHDIRGQYFVRCLSGDIPCFWSPDTYDLLATGAQMTALGGSPFLELPPIRLQRGSLVVKRLADIGLSALGLIVLSPVMGIIAWAIRRTSPGPAIYWQDRVTVGGRVFKLAKFRTMYFDAEAVTGPTLSPVNDERVTPLGSMLRATHLDELPQLWNILRGDMSLVGPRPERPVFVDSFRTEIPHYDLRHHYPPGLTGWAQVAGGYYAPPEEKAAFDLHYAKTHNILRDLWLIVRTAFSGRDRGPNSQV